MGFKTRSILGYPMTDTLVVNKRKPASSKRPRRGQAARRGDLATEKLEKFAYAAGHEAHEDAIKRGYDVTVFIDGQLHVKRADGSTVPFDAATPGVSEQQTQNDRRSDSA